MPLIRSDEIGIDMLDGLGMCLLLCSREGEDRNVYFPTRLRRQGVPCNHPDGNPAQ